MNENKSRGYITRVSGPVVTVEGIRPKMYDIVEVGEEKLMGEVIQIEGEKTIVQVYEDTTGLAPGNPAFSTGQPLIVELGPGLLSRIYDGIQRPLPELREHKGDFIRPGSYAHGLDRMTEWDFVPTAKKGDEVTQGQELGHVKEYHFQHKIMVPVGVKGKVKEISEGKHKILDTVVELDDGQNISMLQKWPVRKARPHMGKLMPTKPLVTGQRILDSLFPLAKGGVAAIPGGFGTGKTITQQALAKWSDAQMIIYIGCGERGNEMTEILNDFPKLEDPRTGYPLIERTVLIANTSNMPVAAREASVYTGMTIGEYYRDMGYDVTLTADSTSRWAEAMREISSRLEEMPGEEGYPAYLSSKLSDFYERAGRVDTFTGDKGSVSVIGAVSPPGGDFSEPVTQSTLRIVKVFWALDENLAHRRHFPAINWLTSYSLYKDTLADEFSKVIGEGWQDTIKRCMAILQKESELQEIVQLVGSDALPPEEQAILEVARMIREAFLQQNAFHEIDAYSDLKKQGEMLQLILYYGDKIMEAADEGVPLEDITKIDAAEKLSRLKFSKDFEKDLKIIREAIPQEIDALREGV